MILLLPKDRCFHCTKRESILFDFLFSPSPAQVSLLGKNIMQSLKAGAAGEFLNLGLQFAISTGIVKFDYHGNNTKVHFTTYRGNRLGVVKQILQSLQNVIYMRVELRRVLLGQLLHLLRALIRFSLQNSQSELECTVQTTSLPWEVLTGEPDSSRKCAVLS